MTIEELYARIGGDYAEAIGRLRSDALVKRFIVKLLDDESCANVAKAWAAGDEQAAFEAAHAAKGVCSNLALTTLASAASDITEALRPGNESKRAGADVDALVGEFSRAYDVAVREIGAFK